MRDNITNLLQRGNLTPKERVLLLVHNNIKKEQEGKEILTEADKHALVDGWTPKDNNEVSEYNRFNNGWRTAGMAELDAQTTFLNAEVDYYRTSHINLNFSFYPAYRAIRESIKGLERIKRVDIKGALDIIDKQREQKLKDGIDFDYAVYQLAFESLSEDIQKDLKTLDSEVEYSPSYLDDEETVADLIDDKGELSKENKEKLADLIAERGYNSYAKEYQLYHSFGSIPLLDVAKHFLTDRGVEIKDFKIDDKDERDKTHEVVKEAIEKYARDNKTTIKEILKETLIKWLGEGLPYPPLVLSKDKNTYNGDTKHPHDEIFKEWLKAKAEARATLNELVKRGELKVEASKPDKTQPNNNPTIKKKLEMAGDLMGIKGITTEPSELDYPPTSDKTITGESLYSLKKDYKFVRDFKKQADEYEPNAGIVYADDDPEHKEHLDKELLISQLDKDGKPNFFSFSFLALEKLKRAFEQTQIIKEIDQDGGSVLELEGELAKTYRGSRDDLIKGYGTLLAFKELFDRLSKTYEINLTYKINGWIEAISGFIDMHNEALKRATGQAGQDSRLVKWEAKLKDDLFIDKDEIKPDKTRAEGYFKEFEKVLGEDF